MATKHIEYLSKGENETVEVHPSDQEQLAQMGHVEQLKRQFGRFSMLATIISLMATWEALCSTMASGLVAGGPVALVYGYLLAFIGSLCTGASFAEIASMCPTAGGQYHFVSALSSSKSSRPLSFAVGWISVFGWQSVAASAPFLAGTMIQGLLVFNNPNYIYQRWHGTFLYWAIVILATLVNVFAIGLLPKIETAAMALHIALFFTLLIALVVVTPVKQPASFVFTELVNNTGWSSNGVAWCIGLLSSCYVFVGYDGAVHLSEEMHDPARGVPFAILGSLLINGILGFAFLMAILFCMSDLNAAVSSGTGFPIIEVFFQATGSRSAASAMSAAIVLMASMATIPLIASASRTLWAFARDHGLPCHEQMSRVAGKKQLPIVSIVVSMVLLMMLGLLNIASTTAFNAILSLATVGLYISYAVPIAILLYIRIAAPTRVLYGPWRLGRWGVAVNIAALAYTTFTCIFMVFPPYQPVTALNMNYASLVMGFVMIVSLGWWFVRGRRDYTGPEVGRSVPVARIISSTDA